MKIKYIFISILLSTVLACGQKKDKKQIKKTEMTLQENIEIKTTSKSLKTGMIDYIEPGETEYTESDVESCMAIIDSFLTEISNSDSKENGMLSVKKAVLALNDLNEKCQHELIETDQREQLAEIIILAGHLKGYNERNEDITEDWREW